MSGKGAEAGRLSRVGQGLVKAEGVEEEGCAEG